MGVSPAVRGEPAYEAQALDILLQPSTASPPSSRGCEPGWRVRPAEAAAALTLSAQKARLGGFASAAAPTPAGEFELL